MPKKPDNYGEVRIGAPGAIPTRHVDHIHGFRVGRSGGEAAGIDLQFQSGGEIMSLTIPMIQALALLSMLKAWQLNEEFPFPDDPRDPNWRAGDHKP